MKWSVVGHEKQKAYLERLISRAVLPHALLLAGPEGIGKRLMAEDIAGALVPDGYQFDRRSFAPLRDEDGQLHDIPIEAMRELKQWVSLRPIGGVPAKQGFKVAIIDDADRLGTEAANTLLKLLEEPPAYARFLLVTSRPGALLPTILSRCERLDFLPLTVKEMAQAMRGAKLDADDRQLLEALVPGQPGAALRLVEDGRIKDAARAVAGLEKALKAPIPQRLIYAKEIADDERADSIVSWWLSWVRSQLEVRPKLAPVAAALLELNDAVAEPALNRRLALDRLFLSW